METRRGIIAVSYGILEQALHLPADHRIVGIRLVDTFSASFEICVEGPLLPVVLENSVTPTISYTVTVTEEPELVPSRTFTGNFS